MNLAKLKNMIVQFSVTKVSDDTGDAAPSVQVNYLNKTADITRLNPYPIVSNPPSRALGLKLNNQGQEENRYGILHDPYNRLKGLKEGEGGIHNSLTGSHVLLVENGDVKIVSTKDLIEEITGDILRTVTGDINQTANQVSSTSVVKHDIIAPDINLTGDVTVSDKFGCNGATAQPAAPLPVDATNLATVITLANAIKAALIANGIGQ